ncbi:hypothetical protein ABIA33_005149 [Streptacidiphilus sp. MAP12-16]|uniref:DUF6528 family protein n=1 Tax=Streptacidiphilus sp. MAP12-16 TaxID=3156300 RepID=UPI0035189A54
MTARRAVLGLLAAAATTVAAAPPPQRAGNRNQNSARIDLAAARGSLLLAADQASERVLILDTDDSSWLGRGRPARRSAARAALWSWSPADDSRLHDLAPQHGWHNVSEAKHRVLNGQEWLLTCTSAGMAALVSYPQGRAHWATVISGANLHSMEILPDGNVAVVASAGGFVRVYTASQGSRSTRHYQFSLPGAHGVQWDDVRRRLWVLGQHQLLALRVGGTAAHPRLTATHIVDLPEQGGHDLATVEGNPDRLWVTTGGRVRQYSIPDDAFVPYVGQQGIDRSGVKSVGDSPVTGQVLTVTPDAANPCTWCTSVITFHLPDGRQDLAGTSLYKARWMPRPDTQ